MDHQARIATDSTRALNMAKRRSAILHHARKIIAREGFESLKVRNLASRAGVTVPTVYNLIGGKPEILSLIIEDLVAHLLAAQQRIAIKDAENLFEAQINELATLFATNEDYYRAAFIAGDRNGLFEQQSASGIFSRSVVYPINACKLARKEKLLLGNIAADQLGRQIYGCYRLARQDWVNGYFNLDAFRRQALTGVFLCLAADASPAFRKRLVRKIQLLN